MEQILEQIKRSFLCVGIMKLHLSLFEYLAPISPVRSNYRNDSIAAEFK